MEGKLEVPKISISSLLKGDYSLIDVRSPSEYREFHIPGAISMPIFSDEERAIVGTTYKQEGKEFAKHLGVDILSSKLPHFYQNIKDLYHQQGIEKKPIVVYCWRGGMRSKSIVSIMGMMEIPTLQLEGGIRSYRQIIMDELEKAKKVTKKYIVLEGLTGTKKTEILARLQQLGYPVINIEELASHRGSLFGQIGLKPRSQKEFESLLYHRLQQLQHSSYYIIEAESKRLGSIIIPDFLLEGKEQGARIHIEMELQKRAETICETYNLDNHRIEFVEGIQLLKKRLSKESNELLEEYLQKGDLQAVVTILLKDYYDPRYVHTSLKYNTPVETILINDLQDGISKVRDKIEEIIGQIQLV
ncbi:tRNA 2-selenouridine(34) synthase MnmH [Bacillus salitolerans]|uniref:tRNA 2-selenouridine(34) synthase MnmH n=1 Tax=Bacillus salitolerans TaxID=1437434 RepID=A0ABW4LL53_9BACI